MPQLAGKTRKVRQQDDARMLENSFGFSFFGGRWGLKIEK